ncbi:MAG: hypothetical protein AAF696_22125, partial [Bacteroidota bacterium]
SSRAYFTLDTSSPFSSGNKPDQLDFEDVFETFALRDELGSVAGGLDNWEYHYLNQPETIGVRRAVSLPIPATATQLEATKLMLMFGAGTGEDIEVHLYLVTDVSTAPANTTPYSSGGISSDAEDILAQSIGFGLNLYRVDSIPATMTIDSLTASTGKIDFEDLSILQAVPLVGTNVRFLLLVLDFSGTTAKLGIQVQMAGFKFS